MKYLAENLPLRGEGILVERSSLPILPENDPPRALKTLGRIIDEGLCHRCGSCIGICPTDVLGLDDEEYPIVKSLSACTDCDLCVKVCPGDEFSVPAISKELFGYMPDVRDMHGHYLQGYLGYAGNVELRNNSTSGGLVTALLLFLMRQGIIDGALVVSSDPEEKWKGRPLIARNEEELLSSTKSKYAIAPTNALLSEIRQVDGRYAVVGLPCQIHGVIKAGQLDRRIKERVAVTIGLFCHAAVEHEPIRFIWEQLGDIRPEVKRFVSRVGKHPGTPHVELKDGTMRPIYFPNAKGYRPSSMEIINILYRLYSPQRCLTCYDATSEFADISVGDPWMAPPADNIDFREGYSFAFARSKVGHELLEQAQDLGHVKLAPLDPQVARTSNKQMGEEKRWRAFRVIETLRRQGNSIPDYGFPIPRLGGSQFFLTEMNILSHFFCFYRRGRMAILKLTFSPIGYVALWLNNKKRRFREWRRNTRAKILRLLFPRRKTILD